MREAHKTKYNIHPKANKMYEDLKKVYQWPSMKKEVTQFMSTYEVYQGVKLEEADKNAYSTTHSIMENGKIW